ncbi:hypothetical protein LAUMK4_05791 [Mycobacterium persicum]|uniref:Uncharacterized protein n=1 Tax=Mycobacterium persicum TaxID=1487726 RepID=A0ABY6RSD4_9MYCO|nr:hypothetical protein A4G31_20005 [Mycobacterium persicum]VAZ78228.1 hypothetical protein LAUMK15_04253 [Mycobacterium persicum]VBA32704.1 hypothetical protein LAUMK4_05791 [Mycobacterium persicum]
MFIFISVRFPTLSARRFRRLWPFSLIDLLKNVLNLLRYARSLGPHLFWCGLCPGRYFEAYGVFGGRVLYVPGI